MWDTVAVGHITDPIHVKTGDRYELVFRGKLQTYKPTKDTDKQTD